MTGPQSDDNNVWADPYGEKPRPVGRDVTLWFGAYGADGRGFEVRYRNGALRITGNAVAGELVVVPTGNDQVVIDIVDRSRGKETS